MVQFYPCVSQSKSELLSPQHKTDMAKFGVGHEYILPQTAHHKVTQMSI